MSHNYDRKLTSCAFVGVIFKRTPELPAKKAKQYSRRNDKMNEKNLLLSFFYIRWNTDSKHEKDPSNKHRKLEGDLYL